MVLKDKKKSKYNISVRGIIIINNFLCEREKNMDQNEPGVEKKGYLLMLNKGYFNWRQVQRRKTVGCETWMGLRAQELVHSCQKKVKFLCNMCEKTPHNSLYLSFLLNKHSVVLFLNKNERKKKKINARQPSTHKQPYNSKPVCVHEGRKRD